MESDQLSTLFPSEPNPVDADGVEEIPITLDGMKDRFLNRWVHKDNRVAAERELWEIILEAAKDARG